MQMLGNKQKNNNNNNKNFTKANIKTPKINHK